MAVQGPAGPAAGDNPTRSLRFNREICAGIFLLISAAIAYYGAWPLDAGSMSGVGSGLMPKGVALGVGAFGIYLIAVGAFGSSDRIEGFSFRGIIFVLGAILVFAATVRPFGLLVAGPLSMLIAAIADPDTRPVEILVFTTLMTAACYLLFKLALRLPIPVLPPLLGY